MREQVERLKREKEEIVREKKNQDMRLQGLETSIIELNAIVERC
jgi:hypothetical protein